MDHDRLLKDFQREGNLEKKKNEQVKTKTDN